MRHQQAGVGDLIKAAIHRDALIGQQWLQNLQVFVEAAHAVIEVEAKCSVFGDLVAGANAEQQATTGELLERTGHFGEQSRVAERRRHDHAPDLDPLGRDTDGRHQRPRFRIRVKDSGQGLKVEVVGHPDGVEPESLRALGILQHLAVIRLWDT